MAPRPYGRYLLEERVAMGGMAEIFRARTNTEGFEKQVCIKRVLPHFLESEDFVTMFRDEAQVAAKLQHANVVQVFDFGEAEGSLYLAMEFVEGADLRRLMDVAQKKKMPFGVGQAMQIAIEMCRGLHHAHSLTDRGKALGLVHRDISPHNVLVSKSGEVKITDFGIAKAAERATHTSTGVVKGKLAYMAPEQAEGGDIDHRVDQFATAIVLWELLTGARLFAGGNEAAVLRRVLTCDVKPPEEVRADIPAAASAVVMKALSPVPDQRYPDMRAFERALTRCAYTLSEDVDFTNLRPLCDRLLAQDQPVRKTAVITDETPVFGTRGVHEDGSTDEQSSVFTSGSEPKAIMAAQKAAAAGVDPDAPTVLAEEGAEIQAALDEAAPVEPDDTAPTRTVVPAEIVAQAPVSFPQKVDEEAMVPTERVPRAEPTPRRTPWAALSVGGVVILLVAGGGVFAWMNSQVVTPPAEPAPVEPVAVTSKAPTPPAPAPAPTEAAEPETATGSLDASEDIDPSPQTEKPTKTTRTKRASTRKATKSKSKTKATGSGKVAIQIVGSWAYVEKGGKRLGEAPGVIRLPAGRHRLVLKNPETKKRKTITVDVKAGETTRVRERF